MCCVATWQLRRRDVRAAAYRSRFPHRRVVVVLALLVIGWMLTSVTLAEWGAFAVALTVPSVILLVRRGLDAKAAGTMSA